MLASASLRLLTVLFKLMKGVKCFKFLKRRVPALTCKLLRHVVSLRCKIAREHRKIAFYKNCIRE